MSLVGYFISIANLLLEGCTQTRKQMMLSPTHLLNTRHGPFPAKELSCQSIFQGQIHDRCWYSPPLGMYRHTTLTCDVPSLSGIYRLGREIRIFSSCWTTSEDAPGFSTLWLITASSEISKLVRQLQFFHAFAGDGQARMHHSCVPPRIQKVLCCSSMLAPARGRLAHQLSWKPIPGPWPGG